LRYWREARTRPGRELDERHGGPRAQPAHVIEPSWSWPDRTHAPPRRG
jgi:hypothetical protein